MLGFLLPKSSESGMRRRNATNLTGKLVASAIKLAHECSFTLSARNGMESAESQQRAIAGYVVISNAHATSGMGALVGAIKELQTNQLAESTHHFKDH